MAEKEGDSPLIISNFEVNKPKNKVVVYINKRIFPVSSVKEAALLFKDTSWVALEENENEILVELKPKSIMDLELLAREFNNELLAQSTKEIKKVDTKSDDFISKIREVVSEFLSEEQGRISKQSILTIGTILATLGLSNVASASHLCPPASPPGEGSVGDGGGGDGCFSKNGLVLTPTGIQEISKIMVGSQVVSYDEKTNTFTTSTVGEVIAHDGRQNNFANFIKHPLVRLFIDVDGRLYETKVTENHPYLDAVEMKYRQLREFKVGDKVKVIEGEGLIVGKDVLIDGDSPASMHNEVVYNLHMSQGPHNYVVNGAVVHNKDGSCCFIAGTKIQMADGSVKNIEKVKVGNLVKSYNEKTGKVENKKVSKIDTPIHDDMIRINFSNGKSNTNTQDHPYYVKGKGWCSFKPKLTKARYKLQAKQLQKGDIVYSYDRGKLKEIRVSKITNKPGRLQTYNLGGVEDNHTYFANGVLVHNKDESGCCFAPNQFVLTPNGKIEINKINANDKVLSYDEKADAFITSTIGEVIVHDGKNHKINNYLKDPLVRLSVMIDNQVFETLVTENHYYFDAMTRRYKPLRDFKTGDFVKTMEGEGVVMGKVPLVDENAPMLNHNGILYNLKIKEGPHNYVVNGAVVHNDGGDSGGGK
ncbi:hypothetical protein HYX08_01410 [Candidatus Woesearchaeota archaeon]|nr:hypothetical protein [Candidatus Woesearchaeota archaeon]